MITLKEQLQVINNLQSIDLVVEAYDNLRNLLIDVSNEQDVAIKLVNYQLISYMSACLNRRFLLLSKQKHDKLAHESNQLIYDLFSLYSDTYIMSHSVQSRQHNAYCVELLFSSKHSYDKNTPAIVLLVSCDTEGNKSDISIMLKHAQVAASISDIDSWYAMSDANLLQRAIMQLTNIYETKIQHIVKQQIANKLAFNADQVLAKTLHSNLTEDFANDTYKVLATIADPVEHFTMYSIMPSTENEGHIELTKYRVSTEKVHNVNIDMSVIQLDADGEIVVPEVYVRYSSIRKRELPEFLQQNNAFITEAEFSERFGNDNMLVWL